MLKHSYFLYAVVVLIWGSTWLAIKYQLGVVAPELSIAYRFALAALVLLVYSLLRRLPLRFGLRDHAFIMLEGFLLFCLNYLLFYWITETLTTGLVAVIFSTFVFVNIFNAALFFRQPLNKEVIIGAVFGLFGIGLIFWPELKTFSATKETLSAVMLGLLATYIASLGNMAAVRNQKAGLPIIQTHAYGMLYGALILFIWAGLRDLPFIYDPRLVYTVSLLYLSLFGTVIAFGCYMLLVKRIGVDRVAYTTVLFPVVALLLSTYFEAYHWSIASFLGVCLVLAGNVLVVSRRILLARAASKRIRQDAKAHYQAAAVRESKP